MANSDGGISPTVIPDVPIPILDTSTLNQNTGSGNGSKSSVDSGLTPTVIKDAEITNPPIAIEVIGTSLDTQQRKILGTFTFGQVGALQIGEYSFGVSGQINISPNGISAVNVNGVNTFTLDGTTGAATFLGTVQAGSFIAGDSSVIIDGSPGAGRIVILSGGIPTIVIGNV